MSCSKPIPPFTYDLLCFLNRDQLERFSIVCRALKNFIERYFHSKPYRLFDLLFICTESYELCHDMLTSCGDECVQWHPNRDDYSAQQFLAGQECSVDEYKYCSFAEMHPYLGPTIRIRKTKINVGSTYNPEQITEMESIAYLWRDYKIEIWTKDDRRIDANDFLPILNSTTILQCPFLSMTNVHFPFKDYKFLYTVKIFELDYFEQDDIDLNYCADFLEQPGVKPIVALECDNRENIDNLLDRLKEAFSTADVSNAFKLVFKQYGQPLTEFRKTNKISSEILELKKGHPVEFQAEDLKNCDIYTLERSNI